MTKPATKRGRLSAEETRQVEELGELGLNAGQIAQRMGGRSVSTIYWRLLQLGLATPKLKGARQPYRRNGRLVRPFTPEEDSFIEAERAAGKSVREIAKASSARFGEPRSAHSVRIRLLMLAASDTEQEPAA